MPDAAKPSKLYQTLIAVFLVSFVLCIASLWVYASTHDSDNETRRAGGQPGGRWSPQNGGGWMNPSAGRDGSADHGGLADRSGSAGQGGGQGAAGPGESGTADTDGTGSSGSLGAGQGFTRKPQADGSGTQGGSRQNAGGGSAVAGSADGFRPNGGSPGFGAGFGSGRMNGGGGRQTSNVPLAEPIALAVYSALFAAAVVLGWRWLRRRQTPLHRLGEGHRPQQADRRRRRRMLGLMLGTALLLRIAIAPWTAGHFGDTNYFRSWAAQAAQDFAGFYVNGTADYPPLLIYVLYLIGKAVTLPGMDIFFNTMIKLPSLLADVLTGYLLYRLAVKYVPFQGALIIGLLYICNPAVLVDSAFWGQVDSLFTLLIVLAVLLISEGRLIRAAAVFAAAVMLKPQGIIFTPVLFFEWVRIRSIKKAFAGIIAAAAVAGLLLLPFSSGQEPLWIVKLFQRTIGEYPYASVNADNFFSLIGANYKDSSSRFILFSYHTWGFLFIVLTTAFSWLIYWKMRTREAAFLAALFQIAGVFTLSTSMHERYLFPAVALSFGAYIYFRDKRLLWVTAGFSFTVFSNIYSVLYGATGRAGTPSYTYSLMFVSLVNVLLVLWLAVIMWQLTGLRTRTVEREAQG